MLGCSYAEEMKIAKYTSKQASGPSEDFYYFWCGGGSDKLHASYRIGVLSTLVSNAVVIHNVVNRDDVIHFHFLLFCAGVRGLHKLASLMSFGSAETLIHPSHRLRI